MSVDTHTRILTPAPARGGWLTIRDRAHSVREDVERITNHPLVPDSIPVHGYIYDVTTGRLLPVD